MAGSRLERVGTVYTRVRDLMRAGVLKPKEKPLWYDVFKAFPPKKDPLFEKPFSKLHKRKETVPEIFYQEDPIRAKFYETYGTGPRAFDLSRSHFISTCQRFVERYTELKSCNELSESSLFAETAKSLLSEGIFLRKKGFSEVSASQEPHHKINDSV